MAPILRWSCLLLVACAGCTTGRHVAPASSATYMRGPDGQKGWVSITCSGLQQNCFARAAAECPGGYDVADVNHAGSSESSGTIVLSNGSILDTNRVYGTSKSSSSSTGEMFVKCHKVQDGDGPKRPAEHNCLRDGDCDDGYKCNGADPGGGTWGVCRAAGS